MREFIGHKIKVATKTMGMVEGILVDEKQSMILIQGSDKKITRIIKADIGAFVPLDFEPFEFVSFHILFCENTQTKCPGVQYIKEGEGFTRTDVEVFVGPCPCRDEECKMGTKGELRSVSGKFLRGMIGGTMFGEYPKKEAKRGTAAKERSGIQRGPSGSGKPDSGRHGASAKGSGEGRGVGAGEE